MNASLKDIADLVQGVVIGDSSTKIYALSPIDEIIPDSLVFAEGEANIKRAESSNAAAILVNSTTQALAKPIIQVSHPFKAFITLHPQ